MVMTVFLHGVPTWCSHMVFLHGVPTVADNLIPAHILLTCCVESWRLQLVIMLFRVLLREVLMAPAFGRAGQASAVSLKSPVVKM